MMAKNKKRKKGTATEGVGAPRPGAAGMSEQVAAASSSDGCKKTVWGESQVPHAAGN